MKLPEVVVDASVAIKWVLAEELSEQAETLLADATRAGVRIVAPPHLVSEITNTLHQRSRRTNPAMHITEAEADAALAQFLMLGVELVEPAGLYPRALGFARAHRQRATYDALYVVLAQTLGTEFWTADETLIRDVASGAPWVRWVGDYTSPRRSP